MSTNRRNLLQKPATEFGSHGSGSLPQLVPSTEPSASATRASRSQATSEHTATARRQSARSRRNVTRACFHCRKARIKCSDPKPCQSCVAQGRDCVEDVEADLRIQRPSREQYDDLWMSKEVLDALVLSIKDDGGADAIEAIRSGASHSELAMLLSTRKRRSPDTTRGYGNLPLSSAIAANQYPPEVQQRQLEVLEKPPWMCSPLVSDELSQRDPFSHAVLSFRDMARNLIAAGVPAREVLSSDGVDLTLFYRDRVPTDPYTVSTWSCELVKAFQFLPEVILLGGIYLSTSVMRWLILPCAETYAALPEPCRPVLSQFILPHAIGVDVIHFGPVRESLITRKDRDWIANVNPTTVSYNWPYPTQMCVERVEQAGGKEPILRLAKPFVDHVYQRANSSVSRQLIKSFPEIEELVRIHETPMEMQTTQTEPARAGGSWA